MSGPDAARRRTDRYPPSGAEPSGELRVTILPPSACRLLTTIVLLARL